MRCAVSTFLGTARAAAAKMQSAGYKPKVEKWDSDSDSDETDEEDLAV